DKVGALFFSDRIEKFIPPAKGRMHLLHIIREMLELQPQGNGTDIGGALQYLTSAIKKKCTVFLLSDLLDTDAAGTPRYEDALKVAVNRHDLSVIKVHDPVDYALPDVGLINIKDSETGRTRWVDTSIHQVRSSYARWMEGVRTQENHLFNLYNVDHVDISTDEDYVKGLMALFARR
ncbi:MAG: VWA domain-containing protein, partial [Clostridia bacterium]|nr:VWA domain-containing protein [Clostridia bacterium]